MQPLPDLGLVDIDMYFFRDGPMGKGQKGMLTVPTEDWVAEVFSPPYLFIDPTRRASIQDVRPAGTAVGYTPRRDIGVKSFYLLHSLSTYRVRLAGLPQSCGDGKAALVLIKLSSSTHGWQNGQQFVELPIRVGASPDEIQFTTPSAAQALIPPAYYMMFYVDCHGKPSVAQMVRFDDLATEP